MSQNKRIAAGQKRLRKKKIASRSTSAVTPVELSRCAICRFLYDTSRIHICSYTFTTNNTQIYLPITYTQGTGSYYGVGVIAGEAEAKVVGEAEPESEEWQYPQ